MAEGNEGERSSRGNVSEVLGELVTNLTVQLTDRLDRMADIHTRLVERVSSLEAKMPVQPCCHWVELRKEVDDHIAKHNRQSEAKKAMVSQITAGVIITAIVSAAGAVIWALSNGYGK